MNQLELQAKVKEVVLSAMVATHIECEECGMRGHCPQFDQELLETSVFEFVQELQRERGDALRDLLALASKAMGSVQ